MNRHLTLAVLAALGGCTTLDQAPLVYTSRNQFGVGVSAGTPDMPGLDVNIGYKGLDAAFVPIVVTRRCDPAAGESCTGELYRLLEVTAHNNVSGRSSVDARRIAELDKAVRAAEAEIGTRSAVIAEIRARPERLNEINARLGVLNQIDPATNAPRVLDAQEQAEKSKLEGELAQLTDAAKTRTPQKAAELEATNVAAAKVLADNAAELERLRAARDESSGDEKRDALSVHGSFGGDANGGSGGANLSLGKSFSTGIAAQNVSQGIRMAAHQAEAARCVAAVMPKIDELDEVHRPPLIAQLLQMCGARDTKP